MSDTQSGAAAREARIRERAYQLWQADGSPDGRADEFWARACDLIAAEERGGTGAVADPVDPLPDTRAEKAALRKTMEATADRLAEADATAKPAARMAPAKPRAKRSPPISPQGSPSESPLG